MSSQIDGPKSLIDGKQPHNPNNPDGMNRRHGIHVGIVVDNADVQRMGRLSVYIPEFGNDPKDKKNVVVASYASPFAGATSLEANGSTDDKIKKFEYTQTSYGMWFVPPDIGNQVLVCFANGNSGAAYWFACVYQQNTNHMVPGVPAGKNFQTQKAWTSTTNKDDQYYKDEAGLKTPVAEYNKYTKDAKVGNIKHTDLIRPWHKIATEKLGKQGLLTDAVRGINDSGARREDISHVYGILTPGPEIKEFPGHRAGGSQFVMDDRFGSEHIKLRTRSGAQIRLDETNGMIYIINRDGTAWIEMDHLGNIDIFGEGNFSVRASQDINLRSDRNINIEAGLGINIKAGQDIKAHAVANVQVTGNQDIKLTAGSNYHVKTGSNIFLTCSSEMNLLAGGNILQTGSNIHFNGPTAAQASQAQTPTTASKTDILKEFENNSLSNVDPTNYTKRKTTQFNTIVSRLPTLEPCPEHTVQKTTLADTHKTPPSPYSITGDDV